MNSKLYVVNDVLPITTTLAEFFQEYIGSTTYCVSDISGEDHIYVQDQDGKPMFDALVSSSRKFFFVWYYIHPSKGLALMDKMREVAIEDNKDFVVKFPNVPVKKAGWPSILRYGKKPAGVALRDFVIKAGNPQLQKEIFSDSNLNTYRNHDWMEIDGAYKRILHKSKEMAKERLSKKHPDKEKNIRGYCLYAGCAYHAVNPELGFGMRDIDVQVFFSPEWYTNTRCAHTRPCGIEEFGTPEYFKGKTRWLDLMWNSFHTETGNFHHDVRVYMDEMRHKSDRWATISQRPMIDLITEEVIYQPRWLHRLKRYMRSK